ncbi:hypothetical protein DFH07DRAFT_785801 [Mycena maculata]|uniref:Uncharacterized protein n=1 Tax=Mycena maculata TaxID=230809 RepID=A0AAD7MFE8_9AGAR|nr:hypothetical protein DFH07DRAFT_785801 [Mycena maculata]
MHPGQLRYDISLDNCIAEGQHFHSHSCLSESIFVTLHNVVQGMFITNADHDGARWLFLRIYNYWGLYELIVLDVFVALYPVFDVSAYGPGSDEQLHAPRLSDAQYTEMLSTQELTVQLHRHLLSGCIFKDLPNKPYGSLVNATLAAVKHMVWSLVKYKLDQHEMVANLNEDFTPTAFAHQLIIAAYFFADQHSVHNFEFQESELWTSREDDYVGFIPWRHEAPDVSLAWAPASRTVSRGMVQRCLLARR